MSEKYSLEANGKGGSLKENKTERLEQHPSHASLNHSVSWDQLEPACWAANGGKPEQKL